MWECGLKPATSVVTAPEKESLLMWECGLKPLQGYRANLNFKSLLMWECGLKPHPNYNGHNVNEVTPYVGVWIETSAGNRKRCH